MTTHSNRPISPHLQAYKLPITGIISISHRMTGVLLSVGLVFVVIMILAVAEGHESYASLQNFISGWFIKLLYWGFIYALFLGPFGIPIAWLSRPRRSTLERPTTPAK